MATGIPARRDKQIIRVLTLLRTLKEGGRPTVHTLAARFHTRRETIYRDLKVLQQARSSRSASQQVWIVMSAAFSPFV